METHTHTVQDVPGLSWGRNGDCTFVGSLVAATSVTPYPCRYEATMGTTGLAFRVRWFEGEGGAGWCPSSPVGEFPQEIEAARKATGWALRIENEETGFERLAPDIVFSIDAGLPVLAYDEQLNMAVIYGAEDEGRTVLMHDYFHGDDPVRRRTSDLKMMVIFLGDHSEPIPPRDAAIEAMRLAAKWNHMRHDPPDDEERGYWHGVAALDCWADAIDRYDALSEKERANLFFVGWWNFENLVDARSHAGPFLRESLPLLNADARPCIEAAAGIFEEEAAKLRSVMRDGSVFLGPWTGRTIADWTPEVRSAEQELLRYTAAAEDAALDFMETALAITGQ